MRWRPDLLDGFEAASIALTSSRPAFGEPDIPPVATLVRRRKRGRHRRAVLYLHGWNDYFFQTHQAAFVEANGADFYALDLRRYGRSLRDGQYRGFVTDPEQHFEEIDVAVAEIRRTHDELSILGHSTGGLVACLWADAHPGVLSTLVLNSPWLDPKGNSVLNAVATPVLDNLGERALVTEVRLTAPALSPNARSLHVSLGGEWEYDTDLKRLHSVPPRLGWLRAINKGHRMVAAGLSIDCPVLMLAAAASRLGQEFTEESRGYDVVLDVGRNVARAVRLGRHVTIVRIDGGMHDLALSLAPARERYFAEIERWWGAYWTRGRRS